MTEVSAGIIARADGRILVCRRGEGRKNAHLWEFPGGKREAGETAAACLARELAEELNLPVTNLREVYVDEAQGIRFTFLRGQTDAVPTLSEHEAARFVTPREMLALPFCPADTEVAAALALNDPPLRHFFWDFDGTLMDTYPFMTQCLVDACADKGVTLACDRALDLMKNTLGHAARTVADESGVSCEALMSAYRLRETRVSLRDVMPLPGIPEALRCLREKGGRHYLVTHRDRTALDMLAARGLLDCFEDAVTAECGFARKPAPDSCLHLLRKHDIDPRQAVMIGDRPLDTAAGRAAGMLSCLLDGEGRFADDPCELRVKSAFELPEKLCPDAIL